MKWYGGWKKLCFGNSAWRLMHESHRLFSCSVVKLLNSFWNHRWWLQGSVLSLYLFPKTVVHLMIRFRLCTVLVQYWWSDEAADVSVLHHLCDSHPNVSVVSMQAWLMVSGSRMSLYQHISVSLPLSSHRILTRGEIQLSPSVSPKSLSLVLELQIRSELHHAQAHFPDVLH